MIHLKQLVGGYKDFLNQNFQEHKERYRVLAEQGQHPKIMMIGCCDSRVNPDLIFNTLPGELFIVRNVANLVPPFEHDEAYHGTSAAIEFAVKGLGVEHIVVMGHSLCSGVKTCCQGVHSDNTEGLEDLLFIPKWTSILNDCAQNVLKETPDLSLDDLSHKVEKAGIRESLENLKAFPFVTHGIAKGNLHIHGAYFDIKEAQLYALDKETNHFLEI